MELKEINKVSGNINTELMDINQKPRKQKKFRVKNSGKQKEVQGNNKAMKIASNFPRILSNENVSPNSKGLRALGWPVKGMGVVPQFFALILPQHLWLIWSAWTFLRTIFHSRTQKNTSVENCCCYQSAFAARPPQASVPPSWGPFLALQNSSYFGRVHLGLPRRRLNLKASVCKNFCV